jgi:hypothetical protein
MKHHMEKRSMLASGRCGEALAAAVAGQDGFRTQMVYESGLEMAQARWQKKAALEKVIGAH